MKKEITCSTCSEIIGSLKKSNITDADVALYRMMVACSSGHIDSMFSEEIPEDLPEDEVGQE